MGQNAGALSTVSLSAGGCVTKPSMTSRAVESAVEAIPWGAELCFRVEAFGEIPAASAVWFCIFSATFCLIIRNFQYKITLVQWLMFLAMVANIIFTSILSLLKNLGLPQNSYPLHQSKGPLLWNTGQGMGDAGGLDN